MSDLSAMDAASDQMGLALEQSNPAYGAIRSRWIREDTCTTLARVFNVG